MKKLLPLIFCLIPALSQAYVYGGTNLSYSFGDPYPGYDEMEPREPYSKDDDYANRRYRDEVERYVDEAREYVENANNDIERIREKQQEALDKAEEAVREYNRWARYR